MGKALDYPVRSKPGEPVYEIAALYAPQGQWSLDEYLALTTNRLIEFNDGTLEFLTMPTEEHQDIVALLYALLVAFIKPGDLGKASFAGLRVQTQQSKVREPDVVLMLKEHYSRRSNVLWRGADLVMEVVSDGPGDRERDYEIKRKEYEEAGIPEYWIVDPQEKHVTVLALRDGKYAEHCAAAEGQVATSALLPGFSVPVSDIFKRE